MGLQCLKIIVHGQVQGVGFRYGTLQTASPLRELSRIYQTGLSKSSLKVPTQVWKSLFT